jgi:hypothetical protein
LACREKSEGVMASRTGSQAGNGERPVVLRKGLLLTMDDGHRVLRDADVLCIGEQIAGIGHNLDVPDDALEIDAAGGKKYSDPRTSTPVISCRRLRPSMPASQRQLTGRTDCRRLGSDAWVEGMHAEIPITRVLDNPYTYTYTEKVSKT